MKLMFMPKVTDDQPAAWQEADTDPREAVKNLKTGVWDAVRLGEGEGFIFDATLLKLGHFPLRAVLV